MVYLDYIIIIVEIYHSGRNPFEAAQATKLIDLKPECPERVNPVAGPNTRH